MSSLGNRAQVARVLFCHAVIGHCARKCQCRSKPECFHLSQDKVLIRACCCNPSPVTLPAARPRWGAHRERLTAELKTGTFYSIFMDLTLYLESRRPASLVTQPVPRPERDALCAAVACLQDASICQHVTSVRPGNNKCLNSVWWDTTLYIKTGSIIITSHFAAFCGCFVSLSMRMKCILCALLCTTITSHLKFKFYSDNFGKARLKTIISPGWLLVLKTRTMSGLYPQWHWALRVIPCYEIIIPGS